MSEVSTGERGAFILGIRENPDDNFRRKVFADWLRDHDETDRAEFIASMIEYPVGKVTLQPPFWRRYLETQKYLDWFRIMDAWVVICGCASGHHLLEVFSGLGGQRTVSIRTSITLELCSGFIEGIRCSWNDWQQYHAAILESSEVVLRKVSLTTWPEVEWQQETVRDLQTHKGQMRVQDNTGHQHTFCELIDELEIEHSRLSLESLQINRTVNMRRNFSRAFGKLFPGHCPQHSIKWKFPPMYDDMQEDEHDGVGDPDEWLSYPA